MGKIETKVIRAVGIESLSETYKLIKDEGYTIEHVVSDAAHAMIFLLYRPAQPAKAAR